MCEDPAGRLVEIFSRGPSGQIRRGRGERRGIVDPHPAGKKLGRGRFRIQCRRCFRMFFTIADYFAFWTCDRPARQALSAPASNSVVFGAAQNQTTAGLGLVQSDDSPTL